jgi:carbon-monoxide dehydrogenase small subunit
MGTEFRVDGAEFEVSHAPDSRLSDVLRDELGMHHVRVSCAEGECGACTVLVDRNPVTSCLMLAAQAGGRDITTVAGLPAGDRLHAVQEAFIEEQGFQCGFCTPGFIMTTVAFLAENPDPTPEEAAAGVSGHICRCGAYPYIVQAVLTAAAKLRGIDTTGWPPHGVLGDDPEVEVP